MRAKLLLTILLGLCIDNVNAQWAIVSSSATNNIGACEFLNANEIFLGGFDGLIKSSNGGNTWSVLPLIDNTNNTIYQSTLYDVHFFNADTGVATGKMFLGNSETIIRTTNGGQSWSYVNIYNGGSYPRVLNAMNFPTSSIGFAVGTQGRILNTMDAGITWNLQASGTTTELRGVIFLNSLTGFIAGNNIILNTTDGGNTWQTTTVSAALRSIVFENNLTGYAAGDNGTTGVVYKTTDGGITWNPIIFPYAFINDIKTLSNGYIYVATNNGIYVSNTGGNYWESFKSTFRENVVKQAFYNTSQAYAVGDNGLVLKTSNAGGNSAPIASFKSSSDTTCIHQSLLFTNTSNPSYTFQWKLNGTNVSTSYSPIIKFNQPGYDTVSLVAYNGSNYDTSAFVITVNDSVHVLAIQTTIVEDTVCYGFSGRINVLNPDPTVEYQLRQGITKVGYPISGNVNAVYFYTNPLYGGAVYNVIGWEKGYCNTDSAISQNATLYGLYPDTALNVTYDSLVCYSQSSTITINPTQVGVIYTLYEYKTANFIGQVAGNGGAVALTTNPITSKTVYNILATRQNYCLHYLSTLPVVNVSPVSVRFSIDNQCVKMNDTVPITNNSVGSKYLWKYDNSVHSASDTTKKQQPYYGTTGHKFVSLNVANKVGCMDSSINTNEVFIYDTIAGGHSKLCEYGQTTGAKYSPADSGSYQIVDYQIDNRGNSYAIGYYNNQNSFYNPYNAILIKFDSYGKKLWEKDFVPSAQNLYKNMGGGIPLTSFGNAVTTDGLGNIYIAGAFYCKYFSVDSILLSNNSYGMQGFIMKLDSNGTAKWAVHLSSGYSNDYYGFSDLKVQGNKLYTCTSISSITFSDGYVLSSDFNKEAAVIEMDLNGKFRKETPISAPLGYTSCFEFQALGNGSYAFATSPKMRFNNAGKLCLAGGFTCIYNTTPVFGKDTLRQICPNNYNGYVAIMDTATGWEKAFSTYGLNNGGAFSFVPHDVIPVFTIDDNNDIYITNRWYDSSPLNYNHFYNAIFSDSTKYSAVQGAFMAKYDVNGNLIWHNENSFIQTKGLSANKDGVLMYGDFSQSMAIGCTTSPAVGLQGNGGNDIFTALMGYNGNVKWLKNIGSSKNDYAYGMAANACYKSTYILGVLDSDVTYNGLNLPNAGGKYFVAKLSYDGTCTDAVSQIPVPIISASGPLAFCQGDSITLTATSNAPYYQWSNGVQTQNIVVKTTGTYSVGAYEQCSGAYSLPITVTVTTTPKPTIIHNLDTLVSSAGQSYQWYFNGQPIANAISQKVKWGNTGCYSVVVFYGNNCTAQSDTVCVIKNNTAIKAMSATQPFIEVYPNPFSSYTQFKINNCPPFIELKIVNVYGQEIKAFKNIGTMFIFRRDELPEGVYFYYLYDKNNIIEKGKIIIQD